MKVELDKINEQQIGPFRIGASYDSIINDLTFSRIWFTFKVKEDREYITIHKPSLKGIMFKELGTLSGGDTKLIRVDSLEHESLDELSSLADFFQSIFGEPAELKHFGDRKDFVHELFQKSEHQVVRDSYHSIQGKPSMMRWNFKSTKCILLFSILEHEEEPIVRFTLTIRLSKLKYFMKQRLK